MEQCMSIRCIAGGFMGDTTKTRWASLSGIVKDLSDGRVVTPSMTASGPLAVFVITQEGYDGTLHFIEAFVRKMTDHDDESLCNAVIAATVLLVALMTGKSNCAKVLEDFAYGSTCDGVTRHALVCRDRYNSNGSCLYMYKRHHVILQAMRKSLKQSAGLVSWNNNGSSDPDASMCLGFVTGMLHPASPEKMQSLLMNDDGIPGETVTALTKVLYENSFGCSVGCKQFWERGRASQGALEAPRTTNFV
jgi:hypothetical protein